MKSQINEQISIRLATPKDKYKIIEIQYNAFEKLSAKDYNPRQLNALLKSKNIPRKSPETIFIAEIHQQVVGFASLLFPLKTIGAVFVDPNFVRRNIGTQLLKKLEQEAINHKVPVLWVYSSLTGHNFYRVNGYKKICRTVLPLYSTYIPCIKMKKRLLPITQQEIFKEIIQLFTAIFLTFITINLLFKLAN